jgi:signal transduction histidine kinase/DNA-binding response OmpR family regulator
MPRTLTTKVTYAALMFLILTSIAGALAIINIQSASRETERLSNLIAQEAQVSGRFEAEVFRAIAESASFARTRNPEFRAEASEALQDLDTQVAQLEALELTDQSERAPGDTRAGLHEQRRALAGNLRHAIDTLFVAVADRNEVAIDQRLAALKAPEDQIESLDQQIDQLLTHDQMIAANTAHELSLHAINSAAMAFILFALMIVLALILLRRQIVRPIKQLSIAAGIVAHGDLSQVTPITGTDEIGDLQRCFNQMLGSLREQRIAAEQRTVAEQARAAAEQASRAKSAFLANMSHELRTPLSAIIGYSDLLLSIATEPSQQDLLPDIQKIQQAGRHLLSLIDDILDLAKIEAGRVQLESQLVDIQMLAHETAATVQPLIAKNGNHLDLRCPDDIGFMHADPTKVRQMLLNLLGNAAKFTDQGIITLSVARIAGQAGDHIRFQVADTGIGISAEQLTNLFQPFTQASTSTSRLYGGTGLGLTLSRHLARMMDGDITVESELGGGSIFSVLLPVGVAHSSADIPAPLPIAVPPAPLLLPDTDKLVLVIDDDPVARELITRSLGSEHIMVVVASSGEEGLLLARDLLPEVIILDVLMAGMDGWSVLAALKSDPELSGIPVVMLTIVDEPDTGFALGASDYLVKPLERADLAALLRKYQLSRSAPPAPAAGRIMIVEDDALTRDLLRRTLAGTSCAIDEATTGASALARVGICKYDLYLIDLTLPDIDGVRVIEAIRAAEGACTTPIVVITAQDLSQADRQRLSGSVERILEKGRYHSEDLLREAQQLIAMHLGHERVDMIEALP